MAYERPRHGRQLRAKCTSSSIAGLLIACAMTTTAQAQSGPQPLGLLNKVGRYMGIGYSRGGYHAPSRAMPYQSIEYQPPTVHPAYGGAAPAHDLPYGARPARRSDCPDCGPPVRADYGDHAGPFNQQPSDADDSDRPGQSQESSPPSSPGVRRDESTQQPTESLLDAPLDDESVSFDVHGSHGSESSRDATRMRLGRPVVVTPTRQPRTQVESLDKAFGPYSYPRDRDPLPMRRVGVTVSLQRATGHQDRSAQATSALPR